jgi:hypothetical protein
MPIGVFINERRGRPRKWLKPEISEAGVMFAPLELRVAGLDRSR